MATEARSSQPRPDLSDRPYRADLEHDMNANPAAIYRAWTKRFDSWFAAPGTLVMRAEVGEPFYFDVEYQGVHHPHYGRILSLELDRVVEMTWLTGSGGTDGAETVLRLELAPTSAGTHVRLAHTGFYTEEAAAATRDAWPQVLTHLDETLAAPTRR
jgi:uncharacterized protein YndB with AHSA1/START domain